MIYYKLDKNLSGEKIIQDIQKLVSSIKPESLKDKVLVVQIKDIFDHTGDNPIPKLPLTSLS